jgi:hypothetical protein
MLNLHESKNRKDSFEGKRDGIGDCSSAWRSLAEAELTTVDSYDRSEAAVSVAQKT